MRKYRPVTKSVDKLIKKANRAAKTRGITIYVIVLDNNYYMVDSVSAFDKIIYTAN